MKRVLILFLWILAVGCGVRGDPVPPGTPAEIGRGKPSYKRTFDREEFAKPPQREAPVEEEESEEESDDD